MLRLDSAPKRLIASSGAPNYGQFDEIPRDLALEDFDYRTVMDAQASKFARYFDYKQFQFVSIVTQDYLIGVAIADIRYLTSAFCYLYDRRKKQLVEENWLRPLDWDSHSVPSPYNSTMHIARKQIQFHIVDGVWRVQLATRQLSADLTLMPEPASQALAMCTPTGYQGWTYTQKHNALRVTGRLSVAGKKLDLSGACAGYDFSAGYMRRETSWRWASINCRDQFGTLGLNLAAGVNETGSCENVLWINGQKHGLPPVYFSFSRADSAKPWHIYSQNGQVDLTFTAENCRREKLNLYWLKSNFRQFIGHFNGAITDNHGVVHKINATLGVTEDHFARW
ncbi:DUF2804 domain-containing protein [Vibrio navarrensis]|uniref:DUF2804 domain-containing protein n=1 Tax=Vibrio navarrensis TaxID=29495 RepID=UPI00338F776F